MRKIFLLTTLLFCLGCGADQVNNEPQGTKEPTSSAPADAEVATSEAPPAAPTPAPTPNVKLPFDLPMMPRARYLSGWDFTKPTKRRGPEAVATIISKGTTQDVVEFYTQVLPKHGFELFNDESSAQVYGKRENGETCAIYTIRGGSKTGDGECKTSIIATKPKPKESE